MTMIELRLAEPVKLVVDDHGAVLLDTRGAVMFGLNPSAAMFCSALAAGADRETATRAVLEAFDADENAIRADLEVLVDELVLHKLAEVEAR